MECMCLSVPSKLLRKLSRSQLRNEQKSEKKLLACLWPDDLGVGCTSYQGSRYYSKNTQGVGPSNLRALTQGIFKLENRKLVNMSTFSAIRSRKLAHAHTESQRKLSHKAAVNLLAAKRGIPCRAANTRNLAAPLTPSIEQWPPATTRRNDCRVRHIGSVHKALPKILKVCRPVTSFCLYSSKLFHEPLHAELHCRRWHLEQLLNQPTPLPTHASTRKKGGKVQVGEQKDQDVFGHTVNGRARRPMSLCRLHHARSLHPTFWRLKLKNASRSLTQVLPWWRASIQTGTTCVVPLCVLFF
jgi:hypothetical protein